MAFSELLLLVCEFYLSPLKQNNLKKLMNDFNEIYQWLEEDARILGTELW